MCTDFWFVVQVGRLARQRARKCFSFLQWVVMLGSAVWADLTPVVEIIKGEVSLKESIYPGRLSSTIGNRLSRSYMRLSISYVNITRMIILSFLQLALEGTFIAQNGICANL